MAIWQKPMQEKESLKWRMIETSDEDENLFKELCDCEPAHDSPEEAVNCPKIQKERF